MHGLFHYHEEHQCPTYGQTVTHITCIEPVTGLLGNVMQVFSNASKDFGASLTSKW
jgi:hypothetical protein